MICKKCKKERGNNFRYRTKRGYTWRQGKCRVCECGEAKEYYKAIKDLEDFKIKNRTRVNKYRIENPDLIRERNQYRRQTNQYKKNRKIYIKKNRDKIFQQERICKTRYHIKNRDAITDVYVRGVLTSKSQLSRNEIPPPLIKLKKIQILAKRILKLKTK